MKTIVRLFFCAFIFATASLVSMQLDLQLVERVQYITDSHFSDVTRYESQKKAVFHDFAQDITTLTQSSPGLEAPIVSESMCQHIVDGITDRLIEKGYEAHNYAVAQNLAKYLPCYNAICEGIDNAFDPNGVIQNSWYANATKDMPVRYFVAGKDHGQNGGIMTPLSFAIKSVNYEKCHRLLLFGADVNKKYPDLHCGMMTPLYETIHLKDYRQGWGEDAVYDAIVKLLLIKKANVTLGYKYRGKDGEDYLPLQLAINNKDRMSVLMLWIYGARPSNDMLMSKVAAESSEWFDSLGLPRESTDEK